MSPRHLLLAFPQPSTKLTLLKGSEGGCLKKALLHMFMDWPTGSFVRMSFAEKSLIW